MHLKVDLNRRLFDTPCDVLTGSIKQAVRIMTANHNLGEWLIAWPQFHACIRKTKILSLGLARMRQLEAPDDSLLPRVAHR